MRLVKLMNLSHPVAAIQGLELWSIPFLP